MNKWNAGLVAGFIATVVLSIVMLLNAGLKLVAADAIAGNMMVFERLLGLGDTRVWGWIWHFVIGTVAWGLLFAGLAARLPGGGLTGKGVVFGVLAWLAMMIVWMPLAGMSFFAIPQPGLGALIFTLVGHLVFGAVLGAVYGKLATPAGPAARETPPPAG